MTNFQTRVLLGIGALLFGLGVLVASGWIRFGPPSTSGSALPQGSAPDSARPNRADDARHLLAAWNAAEGRGDVATVETMYAPRVRFYHRDLSPGECATLLHKFYATNPTFIQGVNNVEVFPVDGSTSVCVVFDKTYPSAGSTATVRAYLILDEHMKIEEESDERTDRNLDPAGTTISHPCL